MLLTSYLSGSTYVSNIGRRIDVFLISQRWNVFKPLNDHGIPASSAPKFRLKIKAAPKYATGIAFDTNRNFVPDYTDIIVAFDDDVRDASLSAGVTATGHGVSVNGTFYSTTYRSGSGTAQWLLRFPVAVTRNSTLLYSYDAVHGNTTSVTLGTALSSTSNQPIVNLASKLIRFALRDSTGALIVSETVKLAIFQYAGGSLASSLWMYPEMRLTTTTDSSGIVNVAYTGNANSGDTVYVGVIRPNSSPTQSMIWTLVVV